MKFTLEEIDFLINSVTYYRSWYNLSSEESDIQYNLLFILTEMRSNLIKEEK